MLHTAIEISQQKLISQLLEAKRIMRKSNKELTIENECLRAEIAELRAEKEARKATSFLED